MRVLLAPDVKMPAMRTANVTVFDYLLSEGAPVHEHAGFHWLARSRTFDDYCYCLASFHLDLYYFDFGAKGT